MGRPRLYATSVERKAAWRRRHGMAVRPHYPSAAAKKAAYRARKWQTARDLAAQEWAAIQQALQTRARSDQCWEMYALIDDSGRDSDMPRQAQRGRDTSRPAGAIAIRYGAAAAARASIAGRSSVWRTAGRPEAQGALLVTCWRSPGRSTCAHNPDGSGVPASLGRLG